MPSKKSGKSRKSAKEDLLSKPLLSLQRCYYGEYSKAGVDQIDSVRRAIRNCLEAERGPVPLEKLILEPPPPTVAKPKAPKDSDVPMPEKPPPMTGLAQSACLPPLCNAIRIQNFTSIKEIHFWEFPISLKHGTVFADTLTTMKYPIQVLEFIDCNLCSETINRIAIAFPNCELLKTVAFDYNEMEIEGLVELLQSLSQCRKLLEISLNYCGLDFRSGKILGHYAATTVVRNLYLDGNNFEIMGIADFFNELMQEFANIDAQLAAIASAEAAAMTTAVEMIDGDTIFKNVTGASAMFGQTIIATPSKSPESGTEEKPKKKKRKRSRSRKRKKKLEEVIPPNGPWLRKLHLADTFGGYYEVERYLTNEFSAPGNKSASEALDCIKIVKTIGTFLVKCIELEELDIYNNWLGFGGGVVIYDALQKREAMEMPRIGMRINRGVDGPLLKKIFKIASGVKKRRKRRRKSAKKK